MRMCNKISVNINSTNIIILQTHLYTLQQKQPHRQMNKYDKSVWEFVVTIMSVTSAFLTHYELFAVLILSFMMYGYMFSPAPDNPALIIVQQWRTGVPRPEVLTFVPSGVCTDSMTLSWVMDLIEPIKLLR